MEIGLKIKEIRIKKGIKQEAIAHFLNIHQSTYAKLENGRLAIKIEQLINVATYLKINVADFLEPNITSLQQIDFNQQLDKLYIEIKRKNNLIDVLLKRIKELENKSPLIANLSPH
jgi:transcriptional regulator with XRE-family HTH domain